MMYWPGLIMLAAGGWLLYAALHRRNRVLAARRLAKDEGRSTEIRTNPKLVAIAAIMRPVVLFGLLIAAAEVVGVFVATDLARGFSVVDLLGFLCLLGGYGIWFLIHTTYREVRTSR